MLVHTFDPLLGSHLADALSPAGFTVHASSSLQQLTAYLAQADAMLIDASSAFVNTSTVLRFRNLNPTIPLLVIQAPDHVDYRIETLINGADDCLSTPLDARELLARLRTILRRAGYQAELRCGDTVIRPIAGEVHVRGSRVHLPEREHALLMALATRPNEILSTSQLLERLAVTPERQRPAETVHMYVSSLRRILQRLNIDPHSIRNIRGQGYALHLMPLRERRR
nr:response regulator transcription factor [Deinobacterium chartae]